jgi:hypothetical protein
MTQEATPPNLRPWDAKPPAPDAPPPQPRSHGTLASVGLGMLLGGGGVLLVAALWSMLT